MRTLVQFLFIFSLFLITGCNKRILRLQTDYISIENLASYHVGSPDPLLVNPPMGQRLILTWHLPESYFRSHEIKIRLNIHYGDHSLKEIWITPEKAYGMKILNLLNKDFFEKKGFLTYRAEIFSNEVSIEKWTHQLWVELIHFDSTIEQADPDLSLEDEIRSNSDIIK